LVSPLTVHGLDAAVQVRPPGDEVTVYPVMAEPPSLTGTVHDTTAEALPAVADAAVGAPGTVAGVTAYEGADAGPVPEMLVAVTVKV